MLNLNVHLILPSWGKCRYFFMGKLPLGKLSFGKMLPLGKLQIWEVGTWEIVTWEVALGKMPLGKYQTPLFVVIYKKFSISVPNDNKQMHNHSEAQQDVYLRVEWVAKWVNY